MKDQKFVDYKPKWINPETIPTKLGYSDCILDTILDLEDLRWYLGYKLNNVISFNNNYNSELTHLGSQASIYKIKWMQLMFNIQQNN